jgi:hypothetical protein
LIELIGQAGGSPSPLPALQNSAGTAATFQVLVSTSAGTALGYGTSYDLGTPTPTTDIVQSMLLDGERPFGYRSSNRTIKLPVIIKAPDFVTMTAAREVLMQLIDQQTWTLTWTPGATGLPMVFDCFRAQPTTVTYGFLQNRVPYAVLNLTFQALPYGRSDIDGLQQVAFASPLLGGVAAPPAPVVLDAFGTVSGTNWSRSTTKFVVGPGSAHFTPPSSVNGVTCTYTKTGLTANITGLPTLSVWFGQSYDTAHYGPWPAMISNVTLVWTLTDNLGHTLSFHRTYNKCRWSNSQANPSWTRLSATIPQTSATFNYTSVASYKVAISNFSFQNAPVLHRVHAWLDAVTANPPSLSVPASQRGVVYSIMGTQGTARTPISCQFQLPQSGSVQLELQGTGLWWPPPGVTSVKAEAIGAGGAGGNRTTAGLGGGGGGGEYAAEAALTVAAGTPVPYSCGLAGSPGAVAQTVTFSNPGTGNWTCPTGVTTVTAECWGAGAGGAPGGGGGGGGEYAKETSLAVTAGSVYPFVVGAGGLGNLYGTGSTRAGSKSTMTGNSVTVTANGGKSPTTGGTSGGIGGTGSANTTHFNGGAGGTSPAGGGGGGGGSGGTGSAGNAGSNGSGNTGGNGATAVTGGGAGGAGATAPGWPGPVPPPPGGGGGGGWSNSGGNGGAQTGASGQVKLTYTIAAGSQVSGSSTTFGSAASSGTVVTAHGGASVAPNTTTGGAGGTGSANTTHFNGGAGFTATSGGGGGGGSGGSASAGTTATSSTGAAAVTGGGKGAAGGGADQGGFSASPPGGGGGGADMSTTAQTGGSGGAGAITLTWTPPLAPFGALIAHRPSVDAPDSLNPCVPIGNTADAPIGTAYTVPSLIAGVNALFGGTYSVVLVSYVWDNPTVTRQVTVTVTQYEYVGGPSYPVSITRSFTPSTDIVNGIVIMGELSLPVKDIDPSNTSAYFTVSISDTDQADQFLDVLFLDSQGETYLINIPPGNSYVNFFIDEPTADRDLGRVMGSDLDRSQAISVLDTAICSGGPFYIVPGDNTFLAYSPAGAPNLGVSYLARWFTDRLS